LVKWTAGDYVSVLYLLIVDNRATFFGRGEKTYVCDNWEGQEQKNINLAIKELGHKSKTVRLFYEGEHISQHEFDVPEKIEEQHIIPLIKQKLKREIHSVDENGIIGYRLCRKSKKVIFDVMEQKFYDGIRKTFYACGLSIELVGTMLPVLLVIANNNKRENNLMIQFPDHINKTDFILYYDSHRREPAMFRVASEGTTEEEIAYNMRRNKQLGLQLFNGVETDNILVGSDVILQEGDQCLTTPLSGIYDAMCEVERNGSLNLIPKLERGIRGQKLKIIGWWFAIICTIVFVLMSHFTLTNNIKDLKTLQNRALKAHEVKDKLTGQIKQVKMFKKFEDDINKSKRPITTWALANIGNIIGDKTVVKRWTASSSASGELNKTEFTLEGEVFLSQMDSVKELKRIEAAIKARPFHGVIKKSWKEGWLERVQARNNNDHNKTIKDEVRVSADDPNEKHRSAGFKFVISGVFYE